MTWCIRFPGGRERHAYYIIADHEDWRTATRYLTIDGRIVAKSSGSDIIQFATREEAELALVTAKIRGDVYDL